MEQQMRTLNHVKSFRAKDIPRTPLFSLNYGSHGNNNSWQSLRSPSTQSRRSALCISLPFCFRNAAQTRPFTSSRHWRKKWTRTYTTLFLALTVGFGVTYGYYSYPEAAPGLNRDIFLPFVLKGKTQVSPTSSVFTIGPLSPKQPFHSIDTLREKAILSVQVKQPQLQITRAYTPLPPIASGSQELSDEPTLQFLVRHEPQGEMSSYLNRLPPDAVVHLRGPNVEYRLPRDVDRILFLAGGTGIAPALQVAYALTEFRNDRGIKPTMYILWANRKRDDCTGGTSDTPTKVTSWSTSWSKWWGPQNKPILQKGTTRYETSPIVAEIDCFKNSLSDRFKVDYFVDEEKTIITADKLQSLMYQESSPSVPEGIKPRSRGLVLLSGSDGFISHYAGPKAWKNGEEVQGALGGVLGKLAMDGWDVWKL